MMISRKGFLGTLGASLAASVLGEGCCSCGCSCAKLGRPAVQLYSLSPYIAGNTKTGQKGVGLEQVLKELSAMGYQGVEFAGYYGHDAQTIKKLLADNGLAACGTHVGRMSFSPEKIAKTCEFNLGYGNNLIICPGGGNFPGKGENLDDFLKKLVDFYNQAAVNAAKYGCKVGLHNHMGEFHLKMADGTTYWDYFFKNTSKDVCMEQDVGWTTCAGENPCEQYKKYPHRSPTLHAKENGMGKGVKTFDAILGQPGQPGAVGVDWDNLFKASDADGVKWYVVECERHRDSLQAVKGSIEFLKSKGRA